MNVELLKLKAFVENSRYRTSIMKILTIDDVKTPTRIAKKCSINKSHISKYLSDLKSKDLIICINEEMSKGRMYKLTELGLEVQKLMKGE